MDRDICTGRIKARNKARPSILKAVGKVTLVLAPRAPASPSPPCCCPRASAACLPACLPAWRPTARLYCAPCRAATPCARCAVVCQLPARSDAEPKSANRTSAASACPLLPPLLCRRPAAPPAARRPALLTRELRPCSRARRARGPSSLVCAPRFGELLRRSGGSGLLVLLPVVRRRRRPKISCFFLVFGFC